MEQKKKFKKKVKDSIAITKNNQSTIEANEVKRERYIIFQTFK